MNQARHLMTEKIQPLAQMNPPCGLQRTQCRWNAVAACLSWATIVPVRRLLATSLLKTRKFLWFTNLYGLHETCDISSQASTWQLANWMWWALFWVAASPKVRPRASFSRTRIARGPVHCPWTSSNLAIFVTPVDVQGSGSVGRRLQTWQTRSAPPSTNTVWWRCRLYEHPAENSPCMYLRFWLKTSTMTSGLSTSFEILEEVLIPG